VDACAPPADTRLAVVAMPNNAAMASAKALRKIVRFIRFISLTCSSSSASTAGAVVRSELPEKATSILFTVSISRL
jgi:hypothetical protein